MAEKPPIVQFPSAQVCGCGECWKKKDRPLRCPNHSANNAFVYATRWFLHIPRCSSDGRYMYAFNDQKVLLIGDLRQNTYKVLKPSTQWRPAEGIWDIAVVDANTIAVLTVLQNRRALYLLRLDCGPAEYKLRLLHHFDDETNVALSSDVGGREVRNVLLGASDTITFVRLNLAEVQLKVGHATKLPFRYERCFHWSKDGRQLYAIKEELPEELHVYSLEQQSWTKKALPRGGPSVKVLSPRFSRSAHRFYAREFVPDDEVVPAYSPLFRFNLEERKWEVVLRCVPRAGEFHLIMNPTDGEEDGLILVEQCRSRFKIQRFMIRNPDTLQEVALVAARKLHEGVQVEEVLRLVTGKTPQCTFLPSAYDGMQPIPIRQLH